MDQGKDQLYLEVFSVDGGTANVPLETLLIAFACGYSQSTAVEVQFVKVSPVGPLFTLDTKIINHVPVREIVFSALSWQVQSCSLPAVQLKDGITFVSGLCAVLRWIIKAQLAINKIHFSKDLLGFRGGCLMACSEVSTWTKFCELDLPQTTKDYMSMKGQLRSDTVDWEVPKDLLRLETHLQQPVRTHNIRKRKQDIVKELNCGSSGLETDSQVLTEQLKLLDLNCANNLLLEISNLAEDSHLSIEAKSFRKHQLLTCIQGTSSETDLYHCYVEGVDMTLADIILWPCVHIMLCGFCQAKNHPKDFIPSVWKWYLRMCLNRDLIKTALKCGLLDPWIQRAPDNISNIYLMASESPSQSFYIKDPDQRTPVARQHDPSTVICKLKSLGISPKYDPHPCMNKTELDWSSLPSAAHPTSGDLPESRSLRKCHQLESIVTAVIYLASPKQTLVDFCSGGGHIGLLLAHYLPNCRVIMIENKEASMERARARAQQLLLKNVMFYQCNLDYFQGHFGIGISLHACGVATDLVLRRCLQQRAVFVCCPCCYGSIQDTHMVQYPRSMAFKAAGVSYMEYLWLCHAADRTEVNTPKSEQGKYCMGLIDTDRLSLAKEQGYFASLCTLQPPSCTPKSNLLIGIPPLLTV